MLRATKGESTSVSPSSSIDADKMSLTDEKLVDSHLVAEVGSGSETDQEIYIDPKLERQYVRTFDFKLLPFLSLMYFFNSMDRSNLSNAYSNGFATNMHFKGQEYSLLLLLYYIPNAFCDPFWNILTKKFGARWVLPSLMLGWGGCSMIEAGCTNFGGMLVVRLLIGVFEAGFYAGVVFYLTLFYTRREIAFRISLFFGSALISGAFTGLLAYGLFHIKNDALYGWQYLFIIEGAATVLISLIAYFWLPSTPSTCRWLTPELKEVARLRQLKNSVKKVDSSFSWADCKARVKTWQWWVYACISFTYTLPWTTASLFLTQIIGRFGFSTVKTNLWTVAPNCVGVCVLLAVSFSSDRARERSYHICFALTLSIIGLIILASVDSFKHKGVSYFACFLLCSGAYIPSALVHSWHNNNNLNESSKAFDTGVFVGLGNLSPIIVTATFRTTYAPKYNPTIIATCVSAGICWFLVMFLGTWQKKENKRRNEAQGMSIRADDIDTSKLSGYDDPNWRYYN
ncbi:unnamed protein product [Kuraishia capsulata CBS 1993]|uniref:Major facilitator superfamily (MFS) profile domain-containing protein n=1 Tax=Kuraishia capsulata CBS 1993 TaxID=1382522 RepID=W6MHF0_9ASCO|nr:uncharacterized protein KUCA_T00001370001 [Kuraishia capsulata CBS 1993]CDK25401.1 unnamed protein product [Kuraishia capsulata CBS 1993]